VDDFPEGVKAECPPWKAAWWRRTLCLLQLTVEHPQTGNYVVQGMRRKDRGRLSEEDVENMKRCLCIWADEKARLSGLSRETS